MTIIGRRSCAWCGFDGAHVKKSEGKNPYHHCPQCGYLAHAKNGHQAELLTRGMRAIDAPTPPHTDTPILAPGLVVKAPAATPAPAPEPKKRAGFFDQLLGGES